jgi:hypothetical protein
VVPDCCAGTSCRQDPADPSGLGKTCSLDSPGA